MRTGAPAEMPALRCAPNGYVFITSHHLAEWGITVNNSGQLATFPVNPCP